MDRKNAKAFCMLGNVLTDLGEFEKSDQEFNIAHKLEPSNPDIMLNWGIALSKQKKYLKAKEKFEASMKFPVMNLHSLYFLGLIEVEMKNHSYNPGF